MQAQAAERPEYESCSDTYELWTRGKELHPDESPFPVL